MKKCIILLLVLQTIFQSQSMHNFSINDIIKGEKSAAHAQETIEIHEELLSIYAPIPDEDLKPALEIIPNSIYLMRACPQSTYGILQEGSATWQQLKARPHHDGMINFNKIRACHEKLHTIYVEVSQKAYQEIGKAYSAETKKLFGELWNVSSTILEQDNTFSKDLAAEQLLWIATSFLKIQQSPENTYSTLQDIETMKRFTYSAEQMNNAEYLHEQRNAILIKLKECLDKIKEPGMLN